MTFELEFDDVLELLWVQRGRCFYSGVPLEFKIRHSHWRMSLERLDNFLGYSKSNCVLIAVEFNTTDNSRKTEPSQINGTAQWSRAKVRHVWGERLFTLSGSSESN
eukprot:TRINITY_DN64962_c0_g1_i1.p1 TRINITY_DN64962_c0_g1~~TRINITY_DN64962_c0_g1_i1.p1  ORF type:complete len:123 (+),score=7.72 TRINITY_DN64962_c0_g1_i1:53-370(+)